MWQPPGDRPWLSLVEGRASCSCGCHFSDSYAVCTGPDVLLLLLPCCSVLLQWRLLLLLVQLCCSTASGRMETLSGAHNMLLAQSPKVGQGSCSCSWTSSWDSKPHVYMQAFPSVYQGKGCHITCARTCQSMLDPASVHGVCVAVSQESPPWNRCLSPLRCPEVA